MTELTDAIYSVYTESGLSTTFTGGCWFGHVPDGTPLPYLVFDVISAPTELDYTNNPGRAYNATVRFTVVGKPRRAALSAMQSVVTVYDAVGSLSLGGSHFCYNVVREFDPIPLPAEEPRDPSAERVYGWVVDYTYSVK